MKITSSCAVSLSWTLKDTLGELLDEATEPVEFLVGGQDLLAKIETALLDHEAGDRLQLHLEPEDAFGDFDDQLLALEARSLFPAELEEGMAFEGLPPGSQTPAAANRVYFVSEIYPEHVVLDANHPLAGMALRLTLRVHAVRQATPEEQAHGTLGTGFFRLGDVRPN
jgi:FKBP-type peptidyl-prolyl cis-trans isomerase SlyD